MGSRGPCFIVSSEHLVVTCDDSACITIDNCVHSTNALNINACCFKMVNMSLYMESGDYLAPIYLPGFEACYS